MSAEEAKKMNDGSRDAVAKPMVFPQNGYMALTKHAKIMKIFKGIDQSKSQDTCFGTK